MYLRQTISVPKVEKEMTRTPHCDNPEIKAAGIDYLKKMRKDEISAAFQKLYDRAKACIYIYAS
jgi:hypothetical protein